MIPLSLLGLGLVLLSACGEDGSTFPVAPNAPRALQQPEVRMIGPTAVSVGEKVTVMGQGFADPELGQTRLTLEGSYLWSSGYSTPVNIEVVPKYVNQGVLEWTFGPNIPFGPIEETGRFRGVIKAVNVGVTGEVKHSSQATSVEIQVLPSILIRQARPMSAGCAPGLKDTLESTPFIFELQAIGLKAGSDQGPIRFYYSFLKSHFRFDGYIGDMLTPDAESLFPKTGAVTIMDEVKDGAVSTLGTGRPENVYVTKNDFTDDLAAMAPDPLKLFKLVKIETSPVPNASADYYEASIGVTAVDASGNRAHRTIPLKVWTPVQIKYDGHAEVVRSFDPIPVSGCIPGGMVGRDVTYSEQVSETRSRSMRVNGEVRAEGNIWIAKVSAAFGIAVDAQVSSSQSKDLSIVGKIIPREFGAFYRQTLQLERRGQMVVHGSCGDVQAQGEVIVTDWVWSPDLAKSRACPPLPISNLQPAQQFKPIE